MTHPREPIYALPLHSAAKHAMLRCYLQAWFPILLQGRSPFPRVTYFEGFAGAGVYSGGEDGSPIIAIKTAAERQQLLDRVEFAFIESDSRRAELLRVKVAEEASGISDRVVIVTDTFENAMEAALDAVKAARLPLFANLDAWGADVPFWCVQRLARNQRAEVLVTFMTDFFRRFAEVPIDKANRQFGSDEWRRVAELPEGASRTQFLTDAYRSTLRWAGFEHTLAFEMLDDGGRGYSLIYGTHSPLGVEKMKDAMWKVDPVYGMHFRDPKDPAQTSLDIQRPDLAPLLSMLFSRLEGGAKRPVQELLNFALFQTVYRPPHAMTVLRELKADGRLGQDPQKGPIRKEGRVWLLH